MFIGVSRFAVPVSVTTDRGRQFESALSNRLLQHLGTQQIRTAAYHPAASGIVERFHRHLKAALMAHEDRTRWHEYLPLGLLGLRSAYKQDLFLTPADFVYGMTLRLPCEFIAPSCSDPIDSQSYVDRLRQTMARLRPVLHGIPTLHDKSS